MCFVIGPGMKGFLHHFIWFQCGPLAKLEKGILNVSQMLKMWWCRGGAGVERRAHEGNIFLSWSISARFYKKTSGAVCLVSAWNRFVLHATFRLWIINDSRAEMFHVSHTISYTWILWTLFEFFFPLLMSLSVSHHIWLSFLVAQRASSRNHTSLRLLFAAASRLPFEPGCGHLFPESLVTVSNVNIRAVCAFSTSTFENTVHFLQTHVTPSYIVFVITCYFLLSSSRSSTALWLFCYNHFVIFFSVNLRKWQSIYSLCK